MFSPDEVVAWQNEGEAKARRWAGDDDEDAWDEAASSLGIHSHDVVAQGSAADHPDDDAESHGGKVEFSSEWTLHY